MKLYNTLSSSKEEFVSLEENKVGMYVCGPTVYDYAHIGHARTYLAFDLLNRILRFLGYQVKYVQNITDVGQLANDSETGVDKIKKKAQETGQSIVQIVRHFTEAHNQDMASLNIIAPDLQPRASQEIPDIIAFIKDLIDKNYAYQTKQGNVYFRVSKKSDYGKLSHRGLAEIITGTRVEPAKDKFSPADFALWKRAELGANELVWESPWGVGFPGWHIECSVMSQKYLGETFDIHGSAIEHIFPHHENEIAQSEARTGKPLARYWVHGGMLTINGIKMGKSNHNVLNVRDVLKEYSSNEIRLAFFQTHYRRPFDYTKQSMEQGVSLRKKLFYTYCLSGHSGDDLIFKQVIEALEDDMDTPRALQIWSAQAEKLSRSHFDRLFEIFGLVFHKIEDDKKASKLKEERDLARLRKDFVTADNRKEELGQLGYEVIDEEKVTRYIPR